MDNKETVYLFSVFTIIFLSLLTSIYKVNTQSTSYTFIYDLNNSIVKIGDSIQKEFKPILTFESKNAWFSLYFKDIELSTEKSLGLADEKVTYSTNDYELWYYPKDKDNFEFEIIINKPLKNNILTLELGSYNLKFYKQLPLNQELNKESWDFINETYAIKDGRESFRPINIVNSYAVYYTDVPINSYSKVYHIYANTITDSKGYMVYTDLNINAENKTYDIIIDEKYLVTAVYPLRISPTFGKTNIGGSSDGQGENTLQACLFTTTEKMTLTSISAYGWLYNNGGIKVAIYDILTNAPNNLIASSSATYYNTDSIWHTININTVLEDDTVYYLSFVFNQSFRVYYDSGSTNQVRMKSNSYNLPNPFGAISESHDWEMSIYANYTIYDEPEIYYYDLTIQSSPTGITFIADGTGYETPESFTNITRLNVTMPYRWFNGSRYFDFNKWNDNNSTDYERLFTLTDNLSVTALYTSRPLYHYDLNIQSTPDGIDFYINGSAETTPYLSTNITKATLQFPNSFIRESIEYGFMSWEDNSTNPYREIILTENMTVTAEYEILGTIILPIGTIPEQTFILGFGLAIVSLFGLVTGLVLLNIAEIIFVYMLFNGLWTLNQQTNMFCWVIMLLSIVTLLLSFVKSGD